MAFVDYLARSRGSRRSFECDERSLIVRYTRGNFSAVRKWSASIGAEIRIILPTDACAVVYLAKQLTPQQKEAVEAQFQYTYVLKDAQGEAVYIRPDAIYITFVDNSGLHESKGQLSTELLPDSDQLLKVPPGETPFTFLKRLEGNAAISIAEPAFLRPDEQALNARTMARTLWGSLIYKQKTRNKTRAFDLDGNKFVLRYNTNGGQTGASIFDSLGYKVIEDESIEGIAVVEMPAEKGPYTDNDLCEIVEKLERLRAAHEDRDSVVVSSIPVLIENGDAVYAEPDKLLVSFNDAIPLQRIDAILSEVGLSINSDLTSVGLICNWRDSSDLFAKLALLTDFEEVVFAEPCFVKFRPQQTASSDWGAVRIEATTIWPEEQGHPDVIVAVIDEGCDVGHLGLRQSLLDQPVDEDWSPADPGSKNPAEVIAQHGTKVAGIIFGSHSLAVPTVDFTDCPFMDCPKGIVPGCSLMPIKAWIGVLRSWTYAQAIAVAVNHAVRYPQRRMIANMSVRCDDSEALEIQIKRGASAGVTFVAAAGNQGRDFVIFPAGYDDVISVAAVGPDNRLASYSNFGSTVDVCAPGGVGSPRLSEQNLAVYMSRNRLSVDYGTSFAAPFVAALGAILLSIGIRHGVTLTPLQIKNLIEQGCTEIDADNPDYRGMLGSGVINCRASTRLLKSLLNIGPA